MFAKSGFVLRTLFVTFFVGSLVACTFDGAGEEQGSTTSEVGKKKAKSVSSTADSGPVDEDAGPYGDDASTNDPDAGPWDNDVDGGPYDNDVDGGPYDNDTDAGPFGPDAG